MNLEQELNKYSKEAIIHSSIFMIRGRDILEETISKEIDLLFQKQSDISRNSEENR